MFYMKVKMMTLEPEEDVVGKSLLSRIKKELPSKVKEVVNINEEEVE